jgi:hypothetical protein
MSRGAGKFILIHVAVYIPSQLCIWPAMGLGLQLLMALTEAQWALEGLKRSIEEDRGL